MKWLVPLSYLAQLRFNREVLYLETRNGSLWKPLNAPSAVKKLTGCLGLCFFYGCMFALITWHCEFWFIDWAIFCTGHRISAVKTPVAVHYQVQRLAFRRPLVGLVEHREQQAICPHRSLEARGSSLNDEFITFSWMACHGWIIVVPQVRGGPRLS